MNKEEFYLWRDYVSDESLREIELIEAEMEKIAKREEKEKVSSYLEIFCNHKQAFNLYWHVQQGKRASKTGENQAKRILERVEKAQRRLGLRRFSGENIQIICFF